MMNVKPAKKISDTHFNFKRPSGLKDGMFKFFSGEDYAEPYSKKDKHLFSIKVDYDQNSKFVPTVSSPTGKMRKYSEIQDESELHMGT